MKYLIFFVTILLINFINFFFTPIVLGAVANIDKIVFINEVQTIAPDTISKAFTIQTQNSSGTVEPIDETADLSVSVTSPTGQFNSNSTTWNPTETFTMSKNTGNKNFYYKDSVEGVYTISATLKTRTTGKSWNASQEVTIGIVSIDPGNDSDIGDDDLIIATTTIATSTSSGVSTHYIVEPLSTYKEPTIFEISAGRERLAYVGTPLSFDVKSKISSSLQDKNCRYTWNFGDGSTEKGEEVEHFYKYRGDYNIVLNGSCDETKAVSRSKIKIVEPSISLLKNFDDSIEVKNNGQFEINLYNWRLVAGDQEYIFPMDTIISANQNIIFSAEYTKILSPLKVDLLDALGALITTFSQPLVDLNFGSISLEELKAFLENYMILTSPQI